MIQDGIAISNTGRGYVLRRILRRAFHSLEEIQCSPEIVKDLVHGVVEIYGDLYFAGVNEKTINAKIKLITTEMDKILKILKQGMIIFKKIKDDPNTVISGKFLADLEQSQGLPLPISLKLAKKLGISISKQALVDAQRLKKEHQTISRSGAEKKFKGGLSEDTPKIRSLHTATHLMLAGLRKYLGPNVYQKGSNITQERSRFDFTHNTKVGRDILDRVEEYVNDAITTGAKVGVQLVPKNEAKKSGVVGSFWEKYPEIVQIYSITDSSGKIYSKELCGGPHVNELKELSEFGIFKIIKEESSSAGVRRIKAVLENK
jgi:alanyl-tRNA synthetase